MHDVHFHSTFNHLNEVNGLPIITEFSMIQHAGEDLFDVHGWGIECYTPLHSNQSLHDFKTVIEERFPRCLVKARKSSRCNLVHCTIGQIIW